MAKIPHPDKEKPLPAPVHENKETCKRCGAKEPKPVLSAVCEMNVDDAHRKYGCAAMRGR